MKYYVMKRKNIVKINCMDEYFICEIEIYLACIKIIFTMNRRTLTVDNPNIYSTPNRRRNSMTKSQFLTNSVNRNSVNPEDVIQSFFKQNPFEKFNYDKTIYRPISYESPNKSVLQRNYVIVDEKVIEGKPISAAEFERIRNRKSQQPTIMTYGVGKDRTRLDFEVKKETSRPTCGCCAGCGTCCGDNRTNKALVQHYE